MIIEMNKQPKILFYDIETSQLTSNHWALYNQNIQTRSIQNEWHIICISYKWLHEKKVTHYPWTSIKVLLMIMLYVKVLEGI